MIFGNHISECCDHGVAFVSTADDLRENQKLSAQFLQQDQEQVNTVFYGFEGNIVMKFFNKVVCFIYFFKFQLIF